MEMPHAVSNLPKYSNVLNFDTCQHNYEVPVIELTQAHDSDDEVDYYDVRNCRMQVVKYYKEMAVVNRINENKKALEVVAAVDVQIENKGVLSPHIIRVDSVDKLAQNVLAAKISSNIHSADSSATVKKVESKSLDLLKGLISLKVSEEALCLSMNGKIEKYEIQGTVGVTYKIQDNDNNDGDHKNNNHIASDLTDKYNDKLVNSTASMTILFEDTGGVLNNIKANSSFISSPVLPDVSKQKLKIENIPKNSPDKISPIMKYSMLPTFQPFYFKARSKMRIQVPNAKILVQIILNPVYKSFFKSMDSFIIQASLSCFLFDKDSKVNIRPIDKFNENTKIVTWVCSGIDVEKETSLELECSLEGISFSKAEHNLKHPESVPLIIKATAFNHLLTDMKINIVPDDDDDDDNKKKVNNDGQIINYIDMNITNEVKGETRSNEDYHEEEGIEEINLTSKGGNNLILPTLQKSKVEFRFF